MFVYFGKLTWESPKIVDESFVIVLPNGPVRVGDTAYLFTQWTNGSRGVKKSNWFQNLAVENVTKNKNGDDTFSLKHHSLSYVIKSQDVYSKLSATITKGHSKSSTSLQRIYEPHGEENTGSVRIWTGKFNWLRFAVNEMAIFITPEGFGEGKPVISLWQFTEGSAGKKKDPSSRIATQKMESGPDGTVKFSYHSYYDITCTWDKQTEHLAVQLSENGGEKADAGDMVLSALIERHTHDFSPVELGPVKKSELEVCLPQLEDSLPRILTPLPFPKGLVETLTHTAAFLDQAGYLAKYAQERFNALDVDFHLRGQQLDATKAENNGLSNKVKKLTDDLNIEKSKAGELQKHLTQSRAESTKKINKLNEEIQKLQFDIAQDFKSDEKQLELFKKVSAELAAANTRTHTLEDELAFARQKIRAKDDELAKMSAKLGHLEKDLAAIDSQYHTQVRLNKKLREENACLKKERDDLKAQQVTMQKNLASAKGVNTENEKTLNENALQIKSLKEQLEKTKGDLTTANTKIKTQEDEFSTKREELRQSENNLEHVTNDRSKAEKDVFDGKRRIRQLEDELHKNQIAIPKALPKSS